MNRFSLQNVKDQEVNRVLRQVQDSLNKLADQQTALVDPLPKLQARTRSAINTLSSRVAMIGEGSSVSSGGGGISYTHTQGVPSSMWIVTHNLGYMPSVTVVDSGGSEVIGDVRFTDLNSLVIGFTSSFSGNAYLS